MSDQAFERAFAAHQAGDVETARRGYLALLPSTHAAHNLGALYAGQGLFADAERVFRFILEQRPEKLDTQANLALTLLAEGKYAEGWRLHEVRRTVEARRIPTPLAAAPEWVGDAVSRRTIVVCGEQGFGDQIMFARYIPKLQARGAEVVVAASPQLCRLFAEAGFRVAPFSAAQREIPPCDAWTFVCSLPFRLGVAEPIPPVRLGPAWRGGGGVGVVPTGSAANGNDHHRSLPPGEARRLLAMGRDLRPEATGLRDFWETACAIAELDLVVTVETAVAHLAIAMGVPTWVLVPAFGADWRWRQESAATWHPSARLIRQPKAGDWAAALDQVEADLARSGSGA